MTNLESHPGILLEEHLLGVAARVTKFCEDMNVSGELCEAALLTALTHDLGKATKYFQEHLKGHRINPSLSSHALLSAVIGTWHVAKDLPVLWKLPLFIAVRSHHANPTNLSEILDAGPKHGWRYLKKQAQAIDIKQFNALLHTIGFNLLRTNEVLPSFEDFRFNFSWPALDERMKAGVSLYFTTNLLLGMLVDADIRAVIGMDANEKRLDIPENIVDHFIEKLPKNSPIDPLRQEFYKTVVENIQRFGSENKFLSLTAPTGIGKTLAGFSAAVRLRNMIQRETGRLPRIIYVLPFTSIIDQNFDVIGKVLQSAGLPERILLKHHFRSNPTRSESNLKVENIWELMGENRLFKERDADRLLKRYEQAHTRVETWDGEVIITTFVRFYETLFTNRRSEMRRFHRLAGSVVIFDEVQNIPAKYWEATEKSLEFLANEWDTRFILMTATRPALLEDAVELTIPHKKFFFNKLSRTSLHIENEPVPYMDIDRWLLPKVDSVSSFMVVMNTVRSAQEVYETLKNQFGGDFNLFFLSASLIPVHREVRINEIKGKLDEGRKVGLVATQVVEAGVDLDFDVVVRDMAPLDSVVQAAGRCNRNAMSRGGGRVYLVNLINPDHNERRLATYIYDGVLIGATEEVLKDKNTLSEDKYLELVEGYFYRLRAEDREPQDKDLFKSIEILGYDELGMFSLIDKGFDQVPVFVELDEHAGRLIERLKKLENMPAKTYEQRMTRRAIFNSLSSDLWGYVVNVPVKIAAGLGINTLPYASSFLLLPRIYPDFEKIYHEDTGFVRKIEHEAIFL